MDNYKRKLRELLIEERNEFSKKIGTIKYESEILFYSIKKKLHLCARTGAELVEAFDFSDREEIAIEVVRLLMEEDIYSIYEYDETLKKYIIEARVIEKDEQQKPSLFQRIMSSKKIF